MFFTTRSDTTHEPVLINIDLIEWVEKKVGREIWSIRMSSGYECTINQKEYEEIQKIIGNSSHSKTRYEILKGTKNG